MQETRSSATLARGTKLYMASQLVTQFTAVIRFSVLARLLGPEQLGLAAIIILAMQFFDFVSDAGMDRFLVQSRDGDDPNVQKLIHLAAIVRGVFISGCIFLTSGIVADFYGDQSLAGALRLAALAPLVQGALHYDMRRIQRFNDYRAEAWCAFSEPAGLVATAIAAFALQSCAAVSYGLVARACALLILSRIVAERPYRIGFSRGHFRQIAVFGTPLMLNGLLMFATNQGDRLFISAILPLTVLAHYSTVILLIYYPAAIVSRLIQTFNLPQLAASRQSEIDHDSAIDKVVRQTVGVGLLMLMGYVAVAPIAIPVLFGRIYEQPLRLIALVALLQMIRFTRIWPTTLALATGRTHQVLINSLIRLVAFPTGYVGYFLVGGLEGLLFGIGAGELLALLLGIVGVNRAGGRPSGSDLRLLGLTLATGICIWLGGIAIDRTAYALAVASICLAVGFLVYLFARERAILADTAALVFKRFEQPRG